MLGLDVKKVDQDIVIKHQFTKIVIPVADIISVSLDDTYGGKEADAIRIGTPYGTTDRVAIQTKDRNYILFTTNYTQIMNTIDSAIEAR
ncbi:SunI/YnzG family protein [Paenibacillus wenxiniae]|uniref:Sublancin immunity protein SunI-like PH domain-containing protein n=1 Tax=Paenibacillus wenxiniae TaxID=1636843 RepID=A0ABW4RF67_9BACL